jgi:hypothetical protein
MKSKIITFVSMSGALILLASGCAHQEGSSSTNFSEVSPHKKTTSDSQLAGQTTTIITGPYGVRATATPTSDLTGTPGDVIARIQKLMLSDRKLAPYPSRITATMDPNSNGRVILSGSVPTRSVKANVVKSVQEIDGVTEVEDRLLVERPRTSREVDLRNPTEQR